jgi:hypothetical protein
MTTRGSSAAAGATLKVAHNTWDETVRFLIGCPPQVSAVINITTTVRQDQGQIGAHVTYARPSPPREQGARSVPGALSRQAPLAAGVRGM